MPKISVIVPCYNSAAFVEETLQSVARQTDLDWELIIVNDGSTDGSAAALDACRQRYPGLRVLHQPNGGVCKARNRGFQESSKGSEYVLFLDADDCLEPAMLETLVKDLEAHPQAGIARCEYRFIDESGRFADDDEKKFRYVPKGFWTGILPRETIETPFVSVFTLCGMIPSICLLRRKAFEQAGGFDENFGHHHEDADLFIRMALDWQVRYVPQSLVRRRRHAGQNTCDTPEFRLKAASQEKKLYEKWLAAAATLDSKRRGLILQAWRFKNGPLEAHLTLMRAKRSWAEKKYGAAVGLAAGAVRVYLKNLF